MIIAHRETDVTKGGANNGYEDRNTDHNDRTCIGRQRVADSPDHDHRNRTAADSGRNEKGGVGMAKKRYLVMIDVCASMETSMSFEFNDYDDVQNFIGYCIEGRDHVVIEMYKREVTE